MKAKSMILIVIALVCGLVASVGISQVMTSAPAAPKIKTKKILVAKDNIDIGDELTEANVRLEEWPEDKLIEGHLTDITKLDGSFAGSRFVKGEAIITSRLSGNLGLEIKIPDGFRVYPIKVSGETVAKFIKPGDIVDVSLYSKEREIVKTILTSVRVFAVNSQVERASEAGSNRGGDKAKSIAVLVTPKQANKLTLAEQIGKLRLLLRSHSDKGSVENDGASERELLFGPESAAGTEPVKPAEPEPENEFPEFVTQVKETVEPAPTPKKKAHSMVVFTPEGPVKYQWNDASELPQQVPMNAPAPSSNAFTPPPSIPGLNLGPDAPSLPGSRGTGRDGKRGSNGASAGVDTASPDAN